MEFLTEVLLTVPPGTRDDEIARRRAAEAGRARELAGQGHLLRLWRPAEAGWRNIGLWSARDEDELRALLRTLPLFDWMAVTIRPLGPHPSDPG
ncbi:muconolactone Delta-isomerase family protein [Blastococcus saxobsidens]|uniref:Putative muconolactone delta-isomerase n=1 Tax=Blastococcus saxobsidens (strain DD2) TaxID=1146883 RepID=H6RKG3_BLASD|nr:muconolactone Delta-isomerase family protein [Blastococcus saxobsidens]CCG02382.1 putative muconolactone delta-isomerase [Blastococcus saxobsidens DD2]